MKGEVLDVSKSADPAFASKAMGEGVAINPSEGVIYAPADGTISLIFPTKHAMGITLNSGVELLIHAGIDTVKMEGKGFETFVETGVKVKKGDKLLSFDMDLVKEKGYQTQTMFLVADAKGKEVEVIEATDSVEVAADAISVQADSTGYIVRVGEMAPDFTITLTDGKQVSLSSLRGKVVMLQFTASWCGVCRKEMPFIEKDIWLKHKNNADFALIGIDRDEPLDKVLAFAKSTGVTYPLGLDPGADIFAKYALRESGITRNVLVDKEGRIVKLTRLYNEEEFASLVQTINEMLK